jgi:hypothetical protein
MQPAVVLLTLRREKPDLTAEREEYNSCSPVLRVAQVLTGREPGGRGVFGNVSPQAFEFLGGADEVIEGILLSKTSETPDGAVDLPRREMLPRLALFHHRLIRGERA